MFQKSEAEDKKVEVSWRRVIVSKTWGQLKVCLVEPGHGWQCFVKGKWRMKDNAATNHDNLNCSCNCETEHSLYSIQELSRKWHTEREGDRLREREGRQTEDSLTEMDLWGPERNNHITWMLNTIQAPSTNPRCALCKMSRKKCQARFQKWFTKVFFFSLDCGGKVVVTTEKRQKAIF